MRRLPLLLIALALIVPARAGAATLQPIGNFSQPIFVTSDPSDANRLFVVQQSGTIQLLQNGTISTFADLSSVISCCGERGLLSMALPSDFPQTGRFYVDYTGSDGPGNIHVAELRATGNTAPISTLRNLLTIPHTGAANHNGGQLQFGPDGDLYISTGDGGGGNDQFHNSQDLSSRLGKLLRIDPRQSGSSAYSVPADNPFVSSSGAAAEVWSYGLRNPFRFSFDRLTGDLTIGDVGQSAREEVDFATAPNGGRGVNYGWNCREGLIAGPATDSCTGGGFTDPIFDYPHPDPGGGAAFGCAIIGGYVVRDPSLTGLYGRYIYSDNCNGTIRSLIPSSPRASDDRSEGLSVSGPTSFGEDACGRLYVTSGSGVVSRFVGTGTPTCKVLQVSLGGDGSGTVTGPGINCPGDCTEVYPQPQSVQLTATAEQRSRFAGWQGPCSGTGTCTLSLDADRNVLAVFGQNATSLKLTAKHRRVPAGARVKLRLRAKPCDGRRHDRVKLYRGKKRIASKRLSKSCIAHFGPRLLSSAHFQAKIGADSTHVASSSPKLRVRVR